MKRLENRLGLCAVLTLAASPALAAPQCVEMRFLDGNGVLIPVNPPLVGIMVGDAPLYEGVPPQFAKAEPGRILPCPAELVAAARKAFEDFCTSDERRSRAAAQNNVDMSVINTRCGDLSQTLSR